MSELKPIVILPQLLSDSNLSVAIKNCLRADLQHRGFFESSIKAATALTFAGYSDVEFQRIPCIGHKSLAAIKAWIASCVVETPELCARPLAGLRPVVVNGVAGPGGAVIQGSFHGWGMDYEEFESGPANYSTAIIELQDGTVETWRADRIRFLDRGES